MIIDVEEERFDLQVDWALCSDIYFSGMIHPVSEICCCQNQGKEKEN
jgi:hypothetical protein